MAQAILKPTGTFVKEVTVTDPDTGWQVELSVFKHSNGGMFAIDSSYIIQWGHEDDEAPEIRDPFEPDEGTIILLGV